MAGTSMQQRRDPAATWAANNPVLKAGEMGYTTDTHIVKFGDGQTPWSSLPGIAYLPMDNVKEAPVGGSLPIRTADGTIRAVGGDEPNEVVILSQISSFGRDRGTGSTLPSTATSRRGDVFYSTVLFCLMQYDGNAWRQVERARGTAAERAAIPALQLYSGFEFEDSVAPKIIWRWDGTEWAAITPITGKMWRQSTTAVTITAGVVTLVDMTHSRVSAGFTFDTAANTLTVPVDGFYEVSARSYAFNGTNYQAEALVYRAVGNGAETAVAVASGSSWRSTDDVSPRAIETVPLKGGDPLALNVIHRGSSVGQYYGNAELFGCMVEARYVRPLGGVTPVGR